MMLISPSIRTVIRVHLFMSGVHKASFKQRDLWFPQWIQPPTPALH
jgi:hypothetical protein